MTNYFHISSFLYIKYPVQTVCTFLLILLFIKSTVYCPAHYFIAHFILFYSFFLFHFFPYLYLCILSCVYISYNCTVHGADLTHISLLITFCIMVYAMNKIVNLFSFLLMVVHNLPGIHSSIKAKVLQSKTDENIFYWPTWVPLPPASNHQ